MTEGLSTVDYRLRRVDVPNATGAGVTYVVTHANEVLWTPIYTRHRFIQEQSGIPWAGIAWGGILTSQGDWVRGSYDFGDADSLQEREAVRNLISEQLLKI